MRLDKQALKNIAYAMMTSPHGCRICDKEMTIHDMHGDQVLAASKGGALQMHRRCWEILSPEAQNDLKEKWETPEETDIPEMYRDEVES